MRVHLKVVGGKNDGREIRIKVPEFIIGRGDEAHLKPTSDLVSRQHCRLQIKDDGEVIIEDMKSRNGTFVNGEALTEPHVARSGDNLRVGRLQFEVLIDPVQSGNKKPKVEGVVDAAARSVGKSPADGTIEDSITDWLNEDDDAEPLTERTIQQIRQNDTIHMNLDDTASIDPAGLDVASEAEEVDPEEAEEDAPKTKKKKEFGKLPPIPKSAHGDSKTAADDVLRRFFNRS